MLGRCSVKAGRRGLAPDKAVLPGWGEGLEGPGSRSVAFWTLSFPHVTDVAAANQHERDGPLTLRVLTEQRPIGGGGLQEGAFANLSAQTRTLNSSRSSSSLRTLQNWRCIGRLTPPSGSGVLWLVLPGSVRGPQGGRGEGFGRKDRREYGLPGFLSLRCHTGQPR